MVSKEDVSSLLLTLANSFVSISTSTYMTKAKKGQLKRKHAQRLHRRAFDCLLFDYDDEFSLEVANRRVEEAKRSVDSNRDRDVSKDFHMALEKLVTGKTDSITIGVMISLI